MPIIVVSFKGIYLEWSYFSTEPQVLLTTKVDI